MLNRKDWEIALEVYKGHPISAIGLAQQLAAIRQSLERGRKGMPDAIKGLDLAIENLYPHTNFHKLGQRLFRRKIEGSLTTKQEELIRQLGVKI